MRTLFLTVLNMSLTASFVIAAVLLVRLLLHAAPRRFSYLLWAVVLFRLLCPFSIESAFSLLPSARVATVAGRGESTAQVVQIQTGISPVDEQINDFFMEHPYQGLPARPEDAEAVPALPAPEEGPAPDWRTVPAAIWLTGAALLLTYSLISLLRLRRRLVGAVPEGDGVWLADHIPTPFVLGLVRPRIYLPSTLADTERDYILLHERTHIRRADHIVKAVAFAALALHWFNPLVWLAFRLAGRDMEMSCDEAVLRKMDSDVRADYSASLLRLSAGQRLPVGPLAFGDGDPKGRIKNVMNYKKPAFWAVVLAAVAVVVCCVVLLTNRGGTEDPGIDFTCSYGPGHSTVEVEGGGTTYHWTPPNEEFLPYGGLSFSDLPFSGGEISLGTAQWLGEPRNALELDLLQDTQHRISYTVLLDGGGSILAQQVMIGDGLEPKPGDDEVLALARRLAQAIRAAEAFYQQNPVPDLSDLAANLSFSIKTSQLSEEPYVDIRGSVNGERLSGDDRPSMLWHPAEGHLFMLYAPLGHLDASWVDEAHTAVALTTQVGAQASSYFPIHWWEFTVELSGADGTVTEMKECGPEPDSQSAEVYCIPQSVSDEEAIAAARLAAKLMTAAEDYYRNATPADPDRDLYAAASSQSAALWDETLAPYLPFGLTYQFHDPDLDGNGLIMWFQGRIVRGIVDTEQGLWITEHMGSGFPEGAVELYAVRRYGELVGLRLPTEQEQRGFDYQRALASLSTTERTYYDEALGATVSMDKGSFSWEQDRAAYAGQPGTKEDGFVHTEPYLSDILPSAGYAAEEVTVEFDQVACYYDPDAVMLRFDFYTEGVAGGGQSVYMTTYGATMLIVYGE